jgi:hypothetical protein
VAASVTITGVDWLGAEACAAAGAPVNEAEIEFAPAWNDRVRNVAVPN